MPFKVGVKLERTTRFQVESTVMSFSQSKFETKVLSSSSFELGTLSLHTHPRRVLRVVGPVVVGDDAEAPGSALEDAVVVEHVRHQLSRQPRPPDRQATLE